VGGPETLYVKSGDVHIAYQVVGDGPVDLVVFGGTVTNCELIWEDPTAARFLRRLAGFSRLILFDKRGVGMSDPVEGDVSLEARLADVRAVLAAAGSDDAVLFGMSEGGPLSVMFAVSEPERAKGLALFSTYARLRFDAESYAIGFGEQQIEKMLAFSERNWGRPEFVSLMVPSVRDDQARLEQWATLARRSLSPGRLTKQLLMNVDTDISHLLPLVQAPTIVMHGRDDRFMPIEHGRWMAERIPGARFIELEGGDHLPFAALANPIADEIEEFITGARAPAEPDRRLATVLFSDVVDSTIVAATRGDRRWHELLDRHDQVVRRELARFRGREVKHTGDGFLAVFDGPAQAIRCGHAICGAMHAESLRVRVGVHTGEVEVRGDDVGGIAVHIAARVMAAAQPSEVVVSHAIPPLVVGSGLEFEDRGVHRLKGLPDDWQLFAARHSDGGL
jgi:pimeloyl-ACP methyl ester carboxylesterase